LVSTNAMALDFDTEWAKFADDFARLKGKVNIVADVPKPSIVPVDDADLKQVDPKSPDRLGLKLSDSSMVQKMKDLYKRDDVVVYSTTVR
jgi:hypothetical protein